MASLIQSNNTYSTTERAIGSWIDGKTIYRKTITGVHNANEVLVSNVSSLIKVYGQADNGTGIIRYIPWAEFYQNKNYVITVELRSNNLILGSRLAGENVPTNSTTKIVIEYTKTTN